MQLQHKETKTLAVHDFDLALTVNHTQGAQGFHEFEHPISDNLRCFETLNDYFLQLRKANNVQVAIATFGGWIPRIESSFNALGFPQEELLISAGKPSKKFGKNAHIIRLLVEYYKNNPEGAPITKVVLFDDDLNNIEKLSQFAELLSQTKYKDDPRFQQLTFDTVLVAKPATEYVPSRFYPDEMVVAETAESQKQYVRYLNEMLVKVTNQPDLQLHFQPTMPANETNLPGRASLMMSFAAGDDVRQVLSDDTSVYDCPASFFTSVSTFENCSESPQDCKTLARKSEEAEMDCKLDSAERKKMRV